MSCAAALVAVMGKLHWEEGHTQLESGKSVGGGWREVGRKIQEERRKGREGRGGRAHRTRSDLVESWAFCALGKRRSLSAGWGRSSPTSVTAAQMSIKLVPIYCWFARVIRNIPFLPLMGWHRDEGVIEEEEKGERRRWRESHFYCSLFSVNVICPLIAHSSGTEWRRRGGREEILCSVEWLTSTCK